MLPELSLLNEHIPILLGEEIPKEGGHYVRVWAPRQTGTSTVILEATKRLRQHQEFDVALLTLQSAKSIRSVEKVKFKYDNPELNFLYLNGVVDIEKRRGELYTSFSSPFVQKRLFNYFSEELFRNLDRLIDPFDTLEDAMTNTELRLPQLLTRYQAYLNKHRHWLFKDAPRRKKDLRIYEAVYHFNIDSDVHCPKFPDSLFICKKTSFVIKAMPFLCAFFSTAFFTNDLNAPGTM